MDLVDFAPVLVELGVDDEELAFVPGEDESGRPTLDSLWAGLCLVAAAYFILGVWFILNVEHPLHRLHHPPRLDLADRAPLRVVVAHFRRVERRVRDHDRFARPGRDGRPVGVGRRSSTAQQWFNSHRLRYADRGKVTRAREELGYCNRISTDDGLARFGSQLSA